MILDNITYFPPPNSYGPTLSQPPQFIVIHATDNDASAREEADYATRRTDGVSIHVYADAIETIGSCHLEYQAHHCHGWGNARSWGIERTAFTGESGGGVDYVAAKIAAQLCLKGGIPARYVNADQIKVGERGITGHHDVVLASGQGDHTDPGWSVDTWNWFIGLVEGNIMSLTPAQVAEFIEYMGYRVSALIHNQDEITSSSAPNQGEKLELITMLKQIHEVVMAGNAGTGITEAQVRAIVIEELNNTKLING